MIWPTNRHEKFGVHIYNVCCDNDLGLLIKGSIANGTAKEYSDIDITIYGRISKKIIEQIVFGFEVPLLICASEIPLGLLIIVYRKGIGIDLGFEKNSNITGRQIELCRPKKACHRWNQDTVDYLQEIGQTDKYSKVCKLVHKGILKHLNSKINESKAFVHEIKEYTGISLNSLIAPLDAFQIVIDKIIKKDDEIKKEFDLLIEKAKNIEIRDKVEKGAQEEESGGGTDA